MMIRAPAIRKAAQGEPCLLQLPDICTGGGEDTVFAHSNYLEDGKGTGNKAHDIYGCFACARCHDELDGRTQQLKHIPRWDMRDRFHIAMKRTWLRLVDMGVIRV